MMHRRLEVTLRRSAVTLAAAATVSGASLAYATVSHTTSGSPHGCYSKKTGDLRIASRCKTGEIAVSWAKVPAAGATGHAGKTGPAGPPGTAGPQGPPGASGPAGTKGPNGGPVGPIGPTGATGGIGQTGATGNIGPTGVSTGNTGAIGPVGPVGATGGAGPQGTAGGSGPGGGTGGTGAIPTVYYVSSTANVGADTSGFGEAKCPSSPPGLHILKGGMAFTSEVEEIDGYPTDGTGSGAFGTVAWGEDVFNFSSATTITVYAICAATANGPVTSSTDVPLTKSAHVNASSLHR